MRVTVLSTPKDTLIKLQELCEWANTIDLAYAWATTQNGNSLHWKALNLNKVRYAIIGTQFAQTEPWILRELNKIDGRLKVVISSEGTFHPKIIIGKNNDVYKIIVGSSNFTTAGFSTNIELNLLIEGSNTDPEIIALTKYIDNSWCFAEEVREDWLSNYEIAWKNRPNPTGLVPNSRLELTTLDSINIPWEKYFTLIKSQEGRRLVSNYRISVLGPFPSYIEELNRIKMAFKQFRNFADMPTEMRKLVIGIGSESSGLLGAMSAAGNAKGIVNRTPNIIGKFLDQIPLEGSISATLIQDVVKNLMSIHGIAIGVVSRILSVKRPDVFVSVNNGSKPSLSRLLGNFSLNSSDHYLKLLELVWKTDWYQSDRPIITEQQLVWDNRAALLDSALYEELKKK
jgi:HKD family nuclease